MHSYPKVLNKMNEILEIIYRVAASIGLKCNRNECKSLSLVANMMRLSSP